MDEDRGHELHRFLGAIFAQELSFSEKEKILVKEFGIKLEGDRKERLTNMCYDRNMYEVKYVRK